MANVKISELTAATSVDATDLLEISEDLGAGSFGSKKATAAQLRAGLAVSGAVTSSGLTMTTARVLGRTTAATGAVEELSSVPVSLGGTGASTATAARTNLGVVIGTDVQAYSANLASFAGKTAPSGVVVGTTDTQTLTGKTFTGYTETVFAITDGAAFEINPANGTIQTITLGASRTPKGTSFAAGQSVTLMVNDGTAYTLTWTDTTFGTGGVVWVGGSAPTLATTGFTVIELWKVGSQVYGALVGSVA